MTLKSISIHGKSYVTVNERIKYFRENFQGYALITEIVEATDKSALIRAIIRNPEGNIVATGVSYERADAKGSMVNSTSHVENCETSAWGRALGNLGIGIDTSVCSADERNNVENKPKYKEPEASASMISEIHKLAKDTDTDMGKLMTHYKVEHGTIPNEEAAGDMLSALKKKLSTQLSKAE